MLFREHHPYRLRRIDLSNFKSVVDQSVELGPLSVVVGANSSGKSTLLQAVLAAAQAVRSASAPLSFPMNGDFLHLSTYQESRNFRTPESSEPMRLGFGIVDTIYADLGLEPTEPPDDDVFFREDFASDSEWSEYSFSTLSTSPDSHVACPVIALDWSVALRESPHRQFAEIDEVLFSVSVFDNGDPDRKSEFVFESGVLAGSQETWLRALDQRRRNRHHAAPVALRTGQTGRITNSKVDGTEAQFDALVLTGGLPLSNVFTRWTYLDHYARAWWNHWNNRGRKAVSATKAEGDSEEPSKARRTVFAQAARDVRTLHYGTTKSDREPRSESDTRVQGSTETRARFRRVADSLDDETRDLVIRNIVELEESEFLAGLREELSQEPWIDDDLLVHREDHWVGEILEAVRFTVSDVLGCEGFSAFRYLGPLRQAPQTSHPRGSMTADLGTKGEYTAEVLYEHADVAIRVPLPDGEVRETTLGAALNLWLDCFGLADRASVEDLGGQGLELKVQPKGAAHEVNLTSVGVGVSQALPVILNCLLSKHEDLLIFEQPELHLHPALQQQMADFLLTFVRAGRQILVETHSEHLVNRLRTQVAADDTNQTANLIKLLFAEQSDGITSYRESEINEYGGVSEDWPEGFLDLSAKSAQDLVRQSLNKRLRHEASS